MCALKILKFGLYNTANRLFHARKKRVFERATLYVDALASEKKTFRLLGDHSNGMMDLASGKASIVLRVAIYYLSITLKAPY